MGITVPPKPWLSILIANCGRNFIICGIRFFGIWPVRDQSYISSAWICPRDTRITICVNQCPPRLGYLTLFQNQCQSRYQSFCYSFWRPLIDIGDIRDFGKQKFNLREKRWQGSYRPRSEYFEVLDPIRDPPTPPRKAFLSTSWPNNSYLGCNIIAQSTQDILRVVGIKHSTWSSAHAVTYWWCSLVTLGSSIKSQNEQKAGRGVWRRAGEVQKETPSWASQNLVYYIYDSIRYKTPMVVLLFWFNKLIVAENMRDEAWSQSADGVTKRWFVGDNARERSEEALLEAHGTPESPSWQCHPLLLFPSQFLI